MPTQDNSPHALRVADLKTSHATKFEIRPEADALRAIAENLGLLGLRKLRFVGEVAALGKKDWRLTAELGATVVQPCVVTLEPVTTRIDTPVQRSFLSAIEDISEEETEMPDDEGEEALADFIDPFVVMVEALSLALPDYPRAGDAALEDTQFTEPGKTAMTDEDAKPFAGLAALREKLEKKE